MASYVVVRADPQLVTTDTPGVLALVVADEQSYVVTGEAGALLDDLLGRRFDVLGADSVAAALSEVAGTLKLYAVEGPVSFEGPAADVAPVLARTYGLDAPTS